MDIINVSNLTKKFKDFTAVNDISFSVKRGEVFAFLGPNGAGKSTTIKMLITLLTPTSGDAAIDSYSIAHSSAEVRKIIGYVPQMISIDGTLTAEENLVFMAKLYDIPSLERKKRIRGILDFLNLAEHAHLLAKTFSGGMIRKLEIGQAILHHPKVLFLDEPTTGLDPVARKSVWKRLIELRDRFGTTIFFSTHYMEEAEEVSDRIAIMHEGKIAAIGTVRELKKQTGKKDAKLDDAFIFFTKSKIQKSGNMHEIKRLREQERKLG